MAKENAKRRGFKKLYSFTFNKLASLRFFVSNNLRQTFSDAYSEFGNLPILRDTYTTDLLEESVERFNLANLQKESEPLISSLWNICKDVTWWAFPESRLYKWKYSFDEGYGRFIELCKQNPKQRRDNLTPEEFEKYTLQQLKALLISLTKTVINRSYSLFIMFNFLC